MRQYLQLRPTKHQSPILLKEDSLRCEEASLRVSLPKVVAWLIQ